MNLREFKQGDKLNILVPSEIYIVEMNDNYVVVESSLSLTEVKDNGTISLIDTFTQVKINKGENKKITLARTDYSGAVTLMY